MAESTSLIPSTIRTRLVRMVVVAGLYVMMALCLLGVYGAATALAARAAFVAWGWAGALAAVGVVFLATALTFWLIAHVISRRMNTEPASVPLKVERRQDASLSHSIDDVNCENTDDKVGSGSPPSPIVEMISRMLSGKKTTADTWVAPIAIGVATLVVVGPVRLIRVGLRALRIARTLHTISGAAAVARQAR